MPAEQIASNLAFVNWTVLVSLAAGSLAAVALAFILALAVAVRLIARTSDAQALRTE